MRIICPEHCGPIEVADKRMIDAFSKSKVVMFYCPTCRERIVVRNILLETAARKKTK